MSDCRECGREIASGNVLCAECAGTGQYVPPGASSGPAASATHGQVAARSDSALARRYSDAYVVARTIVGMGRFIKGAAIVLGILCAVAALIAGGESYQAGLYALLGIVGGVAIAIPVYVLGILVAAQGEILKATLDTAVNTSPLMNHDEMRQAMSIAR